MDKWYLFLFYTYIYEVMVFLEREIFYFDHKRNRYL